MTQEIAMLQDVEKVVLRELRQKEYRPMELLEALSDEGYAPLDLKLAVAQLLHDRQIELTPGRVLRLMLAA